MHACVAAECRRRGAQVLAVNGAADHVHLLVRLPPAVSVAALAKQVKGSSSHLVNHRLPGAEPFAWQRGYGSYSVGEAGIAAVRSYIEQQTERHAEGRIVPAMEPAPD